MATAIPNTICLTATGRRRQGQTRRNPYTSLHGDRVSYKRPVEESREEEEDVNAPPKDSSDEEGPLAFEAEGYGQASDDSEFEEVKVGKSRSSPRNPASTSEIVDQSHVPGTQNDMQPSGGKRKSGFSSNDEFDIMFEMSQPKRQRKSIGYGKTKANPKLRNIHETPPAGQAEKIEPKKRPSLAKGRTTSGFITPPTEGLLAELKQYKARSASPVSPASGTASPNSGRSKGERKDESRAPIFKAPDLPSPPPKSPKQEAHFKHPTNPIQDERQPRTKRLSSSRTKPLSPNSNRSNVGLGSSSATIAATKLGLEDVTLQIPSSLSTIPSPTTRSSASSALSSPPTSCVGDTTSADITATSPRDELDSILLKNARLSQSSQAPNCPLCKAPVDGLFLEGFTGNRRMTMREQAKFCRAHKRRTAEEEWQAKGYPAIDWPFLHMQVKIHSEAIDEILKGERFSFYRNAYEDYLKREKHRTLQQSLVQGGGIEDFSPGYYGSRGAKIMIDNLMATFASRLRRRSSTDSLISSRGISNYVQAVLVPELATLLVMDDLKVDAEKARKVLQDSVELGNFLNEEEDEVIKDPETGDMIA